MSGRQWLIAFVLLAGGTVGYYYSGPSRDTSNHSPDVRSASEPSEPQTHSQPRTSDQPESVSDTEIATASSPDYASRRARVIRVYDGDSLKVLFLDNNQQGEVRIKGIDCPETSDQVDKCGEPGVVDLPCEKEVPLGIRAKSYAKTLLQDEIITLESYHDFDRGNYGRILAYVRTPDGEDYGLKTIKRGYCNDSGRKYDHPRDKKYELYRRPLKQ